ncbi:MAG: type II toxin-antitoxin system VapC family toxin [Bacteroidales bacterium]|nr:type II toxin-antitoxin system VapC family toxin [Bacteroidales bacterium]
MKRALIDTDILSYYFKGNPKVIGHFESYLGIFDSIEICIITYYEITSGLLAKKAFRQLQVFEQFVDENKIIPLTKKSSKISAELYAPLRQTGNPIDDIDILIAGVAIENEMVLVTNNEKHVGRILNLKIENWTL